MYKYRVQTIKELIEYKVEEQELEEGIEKILSLFPKTTSDQHIIPFGFQEEDCDVLLKSKDASIVVPLNFLRTASESLEKRLGRYEGGVVKVKSNKSNHVHYSLDVINFKLKNLVHALSFYYLPQTIPLSGSILISSLL